MFPAPRAPLAPSDPLFPTIGLLPLADPGGGHLPVANVAGELRPFAATLAVLSPVDAKKHDTISTRWTENMPTQRSQDGRVVPDTMPIVHTDT